MQKKKDSCNARNTQTPKKTTAREKLQKFCKFITQMESMPGDYGDATLEVSSVVTLVTQISSDFII